MDSMDFMTALSRIHTAPLATHRERLIAMLGETVPKALACASYEDLRRVVLAEAVPSELLRSAHWEHGVNPDSDSRRLPAATRQAIALTAIKAMIAFNRYLGSAECDAATADAEAKLAARRPVTPDPFGWADDAAEYYGGGSID